jgi:ABC-2 type transport system permease protein
MSQHTEPAAGTIYDIGYQRYDGERLGRAHALRTLIGHGVRTAFGIGRSERAKLVPGALLALALVPAIVQAWVGAAAGGAVRIVSYHDYFQQIEFLVMLFCAAQAPELVTTDQHNRVLPLYFSRPLRRTDYAFGKFSALVLAVLVLPLAGQVTLFTGRVFGAEDLIAGWQAERHAVLPLLATTVIASLLLASISLAIAAHMKARTLASAAIVAFFLVTGALAPLLNQALSGDAKRFTALANPLLVLSGTSHWLFDATPRRGSMLNFFDVPGPWYAAAAAAFTVLALALLFSRYHRLRA